MPRRAALLPLLVLALALSGCAKKRQESTPAALKAHIEAILAANDSGDVAKAAAMTRALVPDAKALEQALRDDAPVALAESARAMAAQMPADDAQVAGLVRRGDPARTELRVHAATTEELKAYAPGTAAHDEFPGGAKKLAEVALRPGVTFYEIEFVEPGKDAGMKYHLFFHDGEGWRMLGPAWRALR